MSIMLPPDSCQDNGSPGWRAHDLTPEMIEPLRGRFHAYYERRGPDECWIWGGPYFKGTGYGKLSRSSRNTASIHLLAHRFAWVAATGKALSNQLTIDHICVNQLCVNPDHLEPVSLTENLTRRHVRRTTEREYPKLTEAEIQAARDRVVIEVAPLLRRQRTQAALAARLAKAHARRSA